MTLKTSLNRILISQRGEVLFRSEGSEWIWGENQERLLFESGLPLILAADLGPSQRCEFSFPPSLLRLREWLTELFIVSN